MMHCAHSPRTATQRMQFIVRLHACKVGCRSIHYWYGRCCVGRCVIENDCVVAAGAVIPPNLCIPAGEVWAGKPAHFVRKLAMVDLEPLESDANHDLSIQHDMKFTSIWMAYKEVHKLVREIEEHAPVSDERPMHWNVWDESRARAPSPLVDKRLTD